MQLIRDFVVKNPNSLKYREEICKKLQNFDYELEYMPQSQNKYTDALATLVLKIDPIKGDLIQIPMEVKFSHLASLVQKPAEGIKAIQDKLENFEAKNIEEAKAFLLVDNQRYKRMTNGVLTKCVDKNLGKKLLEEVHSKFCGLEGLALAYRVQRMG